MNNNSLTALTIVGLVAAGLYSYQAYTTTCIACNNYVEATKAHIAAKEKAEKAEKKYREAIDAYRRGERIGDLKLDD